MNCPVCGDKGMIRVKYRDGAADDFAICLCAVGVRMRTDTNTWKATGYTLWMVWAAKEQVDTDRIYYAEDILEPDVVARIPRTSAATSSSPADNLAAIAAAMQMRRPRL
jgi:hypothetical protein